MRRMRRIRIASSAIHEPHQPPQTYNPVHAVTDSPPPLHQSTLGSHPETHESPPPPVPSPRRWHSPSNETQKYV